MFSALGGALVVNGMSYMCNAAGTDCQIMSAPATGPAKPTEPQPPGTVLTCDYSSDADPGTCYWAYPAGALATVNATGGRLTAAQIAANDRAKTAAKNPNPATFLGMNMSTAILAGVGLVVVLAMVKGK